MKLRNSTMFQMTVLAYIKGYRVTEDGEVSSPSRPGNRKLQIHNGRKSFTVKAPGSASRYPIQVHQLAAIQYFGVDAVRAAPHIRHLNGDPGDNSPGNIALGTQSDNEMDRSPADRSAHAKLASEAIARTDWAALDTDRAAGMSYAELVEKYGVSKGTLSYRYSPDGKRRRLVNR